MNILTAQQIKAWDAYTLQQQGIGSIDLMERAARRCADWLLRHKQAKKFAVYCGKGNNGGDGLAIARMLLQQGSPVTVFICENNRPGTPDFEANLKRLQELSAPVHFIRNEDAMVIPEECDLLVDALFGIGLKGSVAGTEAVVIAKLNESGKEIISIDLPSGLLPDTHTAGDVVIHATTTLTFQCWKLALLMACNAPFFGAVQLMNIGLEKSFLSTISSEYRITEQARIKKIFRPRNAFAHKGSFGHALIMAGSYGKMGAAVLASAACIRSGAGLVTSYVPRCGYSILQTTVPEAMTMTDNEEESIIQPPTELPRCNALGMGPGMGTGEGTLKVVAFIIRRFKKPVVADADALNCMSMMPELLQQLCPNTILTPHPKEFDRLFGPCAHDFERLQKAKEQAVALKVIIVLKGHHTAIALPDGTVYFNTTGNAGMAKGGSGDALTGILTALLAQGYTAEEAAMLGVYLHGKAGDQAAERHSMEAMTASDLIQNLSQAFLELNRGR